MMPNSPPFLSKKMSLRKPASEAIEIASQAKQVTETLNREMRSIKNISDRMFSRASKGSNAFVNNEVFDAKQQNPYAQRPDD